MKTLFSRLCLTFSLIALAGAAPLLRANSSPGVPVRIWGSAYGQANTGGQANVNVAGNDFLNADGTGTVDLDVDATPRTATTADWFSTDDNTVHMEPGKVYTITVDGTSASGVVQQVALSMAPPLGYEIEIDGTRRQRNDYTGVSKSFTVRLLGSGERAFVATGAASQLMLGRVYWQVGLGALRNGKAAGSLAIIDAGASANWSVLFTTAALQYETPSEEISVVPAAGGLIRQIVANQAVIDIVTNSATQYDLKFYLPSQIATGSGTELRTFTSGATPYLTYRVEKGSTDTTLKITSTAVETDANEGSGTRVAVTSLARVDNDPAGWPTFTWTRKDWNTGSTQIAEQITTSTAGTSPVSRNEVVEVRPDGGNASTNVDYLTRAYKQYSWGEELYTETRGSSNSLTTTYDYYDNSANAGSHGYLKSILSPGGGWEYYKYHDATVTTGTSRLGTLQHRFRPFKNTPDTIPASPDEADFDGELTSYAFTTDPFGVYTRPSSVLTYIDNTQTAKSETAYADATGPVSGTTVVVATRKDYHKAGENFLTTVTKFFREDTDDLFYRNQIHSVKQPDGVQVSFAYQRGTLSGTTFTAGSSGAASRIAVITGIAGTTYTAYDSYNIDDLGLVTGKSTLETTIRDERALIRRTETYVWMTAGGESSWQPISSTDYDYDAMGHMVKRTASNGALYTCGYEADQKKHEVDESGVRADFEYDAAGRLEKIKKRDTAGTGFTTVVTYTYDAAGRVKTETVTGTGDTNNESVVNSRAYDDAGRLKGETPAGTTPGSNETHTVKHTYDVSGRTHTVTTTPDGAARTETYFRDGRLEKIEGTGTVAVYYAYSLESDGRRLTKISSGTDTSARLQEAWSDWLGRPLKSRRPGFKTGTGLDFITENEYNATTGRLEKTTRTGLAPLLYTYDSLGMITRSGLDLDSTAGLQDGSSTDRITERDQFVESYDSAYWLKSITRTYFPGESSSLTSSISRLRLTGHSGSVLSEAREWDIEDASGTTPTATSVVEVSRTAKTVLTKTTTAGLPTTEESKVVNGLATEFKASDGLTYTSEYDKLERLWKEKAQRHTGSTVYAYKSGTSLLQRVVDPAGNEVAYTEYDAMARTTWTRNGNATDGRKTYFDYNLRGQLRRQWGQASYPVEYEYDDTYGDRTKMRTFRSTAVDFTGSAWPLSGYPSPDYNATSQPNGGDKTTWEIDTATGLLWKKIDAKGAVVEFDYNLRGQVKTRKLARPVSTTNSDKVTATYVYYGDGSTTPVTGELKQVTYNDGTPSVEYAYDRLGRVEKIRDATTGSTAWRTFNYDTAGSKPWRLLNETLPSFFGDRVLTSLYDDTTDSATAKLKGRYRGFQLGIAADTDRDLVHTVAFTNQPRVSSVSAALNGGSAVSFTYAYESNSDLLDGYTRGSFSVSRDYEANRDLVTRLESQWGTGTDSTRTRFDYAYDWLARRKHAKQSGTAFADLTGNSTDGVYNHYVYNDRGELVSASMHTGITPTSANELPGRTFKFGYDNVGNRKRSGSTGASDGSVGLSGSGDDDYTTNELNQYVERENNKVAVSGTVPAGATVAVAGAPSTAWKDRAFGAELTPANVSGSTPTPVMAGVDVHAAVAGTGGNPDLLRTATLHYLLAPRKQVLEYDADGNLTKDDLWTYFYDGENRLYRMVSALPVGFGATFGHKRLALDFKYDYLGRRVEKIVTDSDITPPANGVSARRFIYDGWNLIAELDGAGSAIQRSYTWGLDNGGSLSTSSSPGSLLQLTNYASGAPTTSYYPTYDDQGNVASLVNATDGTLAAVYEYDPYGNYLRNEALDSAVADNPFRHSTKYHDTETGLVYYGYRYYDPKNGRFINQDPIGEAGGLNLYGFIGNGAVNGSDYLGLLEIDFSVSWSGGPGDGGVSVIFNARIGREWNPFGEYTRIDGDFDLSRGFYFRDAAGELWLYWGDERYTTQPPPEVVQPPVVEPQPPDAVEPTVVVDTTTTTTSTDVPTTPTTTTTPTTPTNPVTPVNPDPPSSAPTSVGFASGASPRMPDGAGRRVKFGVAQERVTETPWLQDRIDWFFGEGSSLPRWLMNTPFGDAVRTVDKGTADAETSLQDFSQGNYVEGSLRAVVVVGDATRTGLAVAALGRGMPGNAVSKPSRKWPKHHPWPQYLGGLREQTLKKLPLSRHKQFHADLDNWKGGKYARWRGAKGFEGMNPDDIINDLRDFYKNFENGKYRDLLSDFEKAVSQTLDAAK